MRPVGDCLPRPGSRGQVNPHWSTDVYTLGRLPIDGHDVPKGHFTLNALAPAEGVTLGLVANFDGSEMSPWYSTTFSTSIVRMARGGCCPRATYNAPQPAVLSLQWFLLFESSSSPYCLSSVRRRSKRRPSADCSVISRTSSFDLAEARRRSRIHPPLAHMRTISTVRSSARRDD